MSTSADMNESAATSNQLAMNHSTAMHSSTAGSHSAAVIASSVNMPASPAGTRQLLGHPAGLSLLFGTEMWERFSYYAMRALLVLYLADTVRQQGGGLGFSQADALSLYGTFTMLVYVTPLLGGYLADRWLGARRAILAGAALMALGQLLLAVPSQWWLPAGASQQFSSLQLWPLYLGLGLIVAGNGLFKPNIASLVGQLYSPADPRRDSAFTVFYLGVNSGMLLAGVSVGLLLQLTGSSLDTAAGTVQIRHYHTGFLLAGLGMLLALLLQWRLAPRLLGEVGLAPNRQQVAQPDTPLTASERDQLKAILLLGLFTVVFWTGFEQMGGLMNLYTDHYIDRTVFGIELNPAFFQSLNPLFILLCGPLLAMLWSRLGPRQPGTVQKFALALVLLAAGFAAMVAATLEQADSGKASLWWLVLCYLLHTLGELCLSPVGLSMVSRLAPLKMAALLMGLWYLFLALANKLAGWVGSLIGSGVAASSGETAPHSGLAEHSGLAHSGLTEHSGLAEQALSIFAGLGLAAVLSAILLLMLSDRLGRWMLPAAAPASSAGTAAKHG